EAILIDSSPEQEKGGGGGPDEEEEELEDIGEAAVLEGRAIGQAIARLKGMTGEPPFQVFDKKSGGLRPLSFRDIVILLRADKAWAPELIEQLRLFGIPAYA